MPTNTSPRIGKFPTTTVAWSDGSAFNGFALVGLIPATDGVTSYTEGDFGLMFPSERLPAFSIIPISNGLFNASLGLYYNADISPINTTYNLRYYDTTKRLIAGPSSPFTVSADPVVLPALTLTAPITGGTAPTPN